MRAKIVFFIVGVLAILGFIALNVQASPNNNNSIHPSVINEGWSSALSTSNAINPSGLTTISNGSGGFLTNSFTTANASTELTATLGSSPVTTQKFTASGVAFGMNTTSDALNASLDLTVTGIKPTAFGAVASGVSDANFTGTSGFSQTYVTGNLTALNGNDISGQLTSGAFSGAQGLDAASAFSSSALSFGTHP